MRWLGSGRGADAGPVAAALAAWVGALWGERAGAGHGVVAAVTACGAGVLWWGVRARSWFRLVLIAIVVAGTGVASMQRALDGLEHHALRNGVATGAAVVIDGVLSDDPRPSRFSTSALVRVSTVSIAGASHRPVDRVVLLHASGRVAGGLSVLDAGDRVVVAGDLRPLEGFDARARWNHAVARVDLVELVAARPARGFPWSIANALRARVQRGIEGLPERHRALLNGFVLGDTRAVDVATSSAFRSAGMSHLLAVSGANVAFVLALVGPLLRRSRLGVRFIVGVTVVTVFAAMTRFEPSVLRASVMALVVMTARFSGRAVAPVRVLAFAVTVLVIADPFLVHSVGFQLSVAACVGIVVIAPRVVPRVPGPHWIRQVVGVSVGAQVGVAPVLWAVFGSVAWIAPAANLFAVPLAEPITVIALPVALVAASWSAARLGLVPVAGLLTAVQTVARVANEQPVALAACAVVVVALLGVVVRRSAVDSTS